MKNYHFENEFVNCREGFNHVTTLYVDDEKVGSYKVHYVNRTWESYEFQSVMKGCVTMILENLKNELSDQWKADHGYKCMTKKRKEVFEKELEKNSDYKFYQKIYNEL